MNGYQETHDQLAAAATARGWEVLPAQELSPGYGLLEVKRPGEAIVVSWSPVAGEKHMAVHAKCGEHFPTYYSYNPDDIDVYVRNIL